ncbi:MAG: ABC transporter permease subunit [Defluviitaleaceae bacterium]|nr:ABC transporter permease subunit [Defluviitaleaceae bacterium]
MPIVLFWLLVWEAVAAIIGSDLVIVSPRVTFARLLELAQTAVFWQSIGTTLGRILRGFLFALIAGTVLAALAARFKTFLKLILPAVNTMNAVPIASFTILALIAFNPSDLAIFVSFVTVLPIIFYNTHKGIESTDPQLLEMAQIFRVPARKVIFRIYFKTVAPYVAAAATSGIGFAWKSGIAAELIGQVSGTIGMNLHAARIWLNTADVFAWTVAIVLLSYGMERTFRIILRVKV